LIQAPASCSSSSSRSRSAGPSKTASRFRWSRPQRRRATFAPFPTPRMRCLRGPRATRAWRWRWWRRSAGTS
jgi:hypothetical protein